VKIKVALHGMDKRSEERMLTIFSMNFKDQCEHVDINNADTVIYDMDDKNVNEEWSKFRAEYPDIPVIIMSKDTIDLDGVLHISKPAKLANLLTALKESSNKEIGSSLKSTANVAHALQDRDRHANKNLGTTEKFGMYYKPEMFLQDKIVKAIKKSHELKKDIFLKCWTDHWILISPFTNFLLQNINDIQIKTLGLVVLGEGPDQLSFSEHLFSNDEIMHMANTPTNKVKIVPTDQFLWDLTVKTARGRIPEGTSLDELYVLQYWPNLPHLLHIANATRISAFWIDKPQSINNVVEKLAIPVEDVLTYFSAATATGLLMPAKRKEDMLVTPEIIETDKKRHGIFKALIGKIGKNITYKKDSVVDEA